MKPRAKILIALGLVILFAIAFVIILPSPRRRIPAGSIVLVDRPKIDPVPWLLLSNSTTRNQTVYVSFASSEPRAHFLLSANPFVRIAPHRTELVHIPDPPPGTAKLQIMVSEEIKGPERWLRGARLWVSSKNARGPGGNPFGTHVNYYGHRTDFAAELLKGSTNRIARGLN